MQVEYFCLPGRLINNRWTSATLTCLQDGSWFPPSSSVNCLLQECPALPSLPHSMYKNSSQVFKLLKCLAFMQLEIGGGL